MIHNTVFPSVMYEQCIRTLFLLCILYTIMQTLNHAPDHFVLCGEVYLSMREALTQSIVDESVDHFKQHVQVGVQQVYLFSDFNFFILSSISNRIFPLLMPLCCHWCFSVSWYGPVELPAASEER